MYTQHLRADGSSLECMSMELGAAALRARSACADPTSGQYHWTQVANSVQGYISLIVNLDADLD